MPKIQPHPLVVMDMIAKALIDGGPYPQHRFKMVASYPPHCLNMSDRRGEWHSGDAPSHLADLVKLQFSGSALPSRLLVTKHPNGASGVFETVIEYDYGAGFSEATLAWCGAPPALD